MSNDYLHSVDESIQWTQRKINQFHKTVSAFEASQPYRLVIQNEHGGKSKGLYFYWKEPFPADFALEARCIVQGIRSPLDYIINAVALEQGIDPTKRRFVFPITKDVKALDDTIKRTRMDQIHPDLTNIVRAIKPYNKGNQDLFRLKMLNDGEKHCKLSPLGGFQGDARIPGYIFNNLQGSVEIPALGSIPLEDGMKLMTINTTSEFTPEMTFSFNIVFEDLEGAERLPVTSVFDAMLRQVEGACAIIRARFFS